jgi:hypothetical protein
MWGRWAIRTKHKERVFRRQVSTFLGLERVSDRGGESLRQRNIMVALLLWLGISDRKGNEQTTVEGYAFGAWAWLWEPVSLS